MATSEIDGRPIYWDPARGWCYIDDQAPIRPAKSN